MKAGTIKLHEGRFLIECPPHVAIKLRRVFGGIQRHGAGRFVLSANPATAHELAWFRERHPLELVDCERAFRKLVRTEGYHNDAGACLLAASCKCGGIPPGCVTPIEEM